jgi:hypothetical protein
VAAAVIRAGPAFALLFWRGRDGWGRAAQLVLGARRTQDGPVSRPIVEGRANADQGIAGSTAKEHPGNLQKGQSLQPDSMKGDGDWQK